VLEQRGKEGAESHEKYDRVRQGYGRA
jgi:hypothetical protein